MKPAVVSGQTGQSSSATIVRLILPGIALAEVLSVGSVATTPPG